MLKKCLGICLVITLLFSAFTFNSSAVEENDENTIMPRWSVIDGIGIGFSISGIVSTASVSLTAKYSTRLYIKIELQKEKSTGYETIETWTQFANDTYVALEKTRLINIFENYRIKVTCIADNEQQILYDYP